MPHAILVTRLARLAAVASLGALVACTQDPSAGVAPRPVGQESFVSQAPGSGGTRDAPGVASPGAATGVDATATPGASTQRAVEEADIYRLAGSTLYVLNGLRGLQIADLTDLDHPVLRARVPVVGQPVDLYLRGTTAVFAVSDTFAYAWVADAAVAASESNNDPVVSVRFTSPAPALRFSAVRPLASVTNWLPPPAEVSTLNVPTLV